MLVPNIVGPIEIGIETVATLAAEEKRLRATIVAGLVPTARTGLTGVSWVNLDDRHPACLGLVPEEAVELVKAPTVEASLPFALSHLRSFANVAQVLDNNGSSWVSVLHNALGEDMIVVFSLPKQFARKFFQVPFGRFASFFLKLATKAEDAAFLFLPATFSQEMTSARHSRSIQTQVNPDHFFGRKDVWSGNGYDEVEEIAPFAIAQISTAYLVTCVLYGMFGDAERAFHTPCYCSKTGGVGLPFDPVGTLVIADGSASRLWTLDRLELRGRLTSPQSLSYLLWVGLFVFLLPRQRRLHGFSGFDTSGTDQLSRQIWILGTQWIVGLLMQFHAIAALLGEAQSGHLVEASGMLLKRLFEDASLLWCWVQLYHHRSVHTKNISYIPKIGNGTPRYPSPKKGRPASSPVWKDGVSAGRVI